MLRAVSAEVPDIDACASRLDPQLDIGYDRIAARCPELVRQLEQGEWAPWLPRGWKESGNDLSAGGLKELQDLVNREGAARISRPAPDVRRLNAVLRGLTSKNADGWWSRFKSWLRSLLERQEQPTDEGWFTRMASRVGVPQSLRQIIAYAALAAVVLLAGAILVNELRTAGLLRVRGWLRRRARTASAAVMSESGSADFDQAPLRDRPRVLLELIVRRLTERGLLPPAGALTVRELARIARLPEPADRTRLSELALTAERVRYSSREPQPAALDGPISQGRELLHRLDAGVS